MLLAAAMAAKRLDFARSPRGCRRQPRKHLYTGGAAVAREWRLVAALKAGEMLQGRGRVVGLLAAGLGPVGMRTAW